MVSSMYINQRVVFFPTIFFLFVHPTCVLTFMKEFLTSPKLSIEHYSYTMYSSFCTLSINNIYGCMYNHIFGGVNELEF